MPELGDAGAVARESRRRRFPLAQPEPEPDWDGGMGVVLHVCWRVLARP
jgi:hypothetical protein